MARVAKVKEPTAEAGSEEGSIGTIRVPKIAFATFRFWLVGDTPLITHAWSQKAKIEMYTKQVAGRRVTGKSRDAKNPIEDFNDSLYKIGDGIYGFPAMGIKNCLLSAAHKDKGIPRETVLRTLWIDAPMYPVKPAHDGALCDMPLVQIYGNDPVMREDMVKVGRGLNKTAAFAYRGQFTHWAMLLKGRYNASVLTREAIVYLIQDSGLSSGLGEWRNEKRGMFGAFHVASELAEQRAWDAYSRGEGPLPISDSFEYHDMPEAAE